MTTIRNCDIQAVRDPITGGRYFPHLAMEPYQGREEEPPAFVIRYSKLGTCGMYFPKGIATRLKGYKEEGPKPPRYCSVTGFKLRERPMHYYTIYHDRPSGGKEPMVTILPKFYHIDNAGFFTSSKFYLIAHAGCLRDPEPAIDAIRATDDFLREVMFHKLYWKQPPFRIHLMNPLGPPLKELTPCYDLLTQSAERKLPKPEWCPLDLTIQRTLERKANRLARGMHHQTPSPSEASLLRMLPPIRPLAGYCQPNNPDGTMSPCPFGCALEKGITGGAIACKHLLHGERPHHPPPAKQEAADTMTTSE